MSLTQIQTIPATPGGFDEWTYWHFLHHQAIIAAAKQIKNVDLTQYRIWPVSQHNIEDWLIQHQQMHTDMCALYNVFGNDLSSLDFQDPRQIQGFAWLNFQEHQAVAARCGVPI